MTAALFNQSGGNFANVVDGFVYPQFIGYALRAPTTQDIYNPGTRWQDNSVNPAVIYQTTGAGVWFTDSGSAGMFTTLAVTGNATIGGTLGVTGLTTLTNMTAGIIQSTNEVLSPKVIIDGSAGSTVALQVTGSSSTTIEAMTISAADAVTDAIQVQQGGISVSPTVVTAGASPRVANGRFGQATFSGVSIAAGATQTLVITNSTIASSSSVILYSMVGGTTGSALSIQSVTNSGGSSSIVVANGTGATTSTANLTFVFWVMS